MDLTQLFYATGAAGFFTSRAFLPAFLTALSMKYGVHIPLLGELDMLESMSGHSGILTSDWMILLLGTLSAAEIAGEKVAEVQELLNEFGSYVKPVIATLTTMGVLGADEAKAAGEVLTYHAGFLDLFPSAAVGGLVFFFSQSRAEILTILAQGDEGDDLGLRKLISWFEDLWASFGFLILLIFPVIMVVVIGLTLGSVHLIRVRLKRKEEKQKVNCPNCEASLYGSALYCHSCGHENPDPRKVGWLGQTIKDSIEDARTHAQNLVEKRRCRRCAAHLEKKRVNQSCPQCATEPFADPAFAEAYLNAVSNRLPRVLLVGTGLSFIPVAGLIAGILYYRTQLVTPLKAYIPAGKNLLLRWGLRLFFFILIGLQWIPIAGAAVVPIMALTNYKVYRNGFVKQLRQQASS